VFRDHVTIVAVTKEEDMRYMPPPWSVTVLLVKVSPINDTVPALDA